MKIAIYSGIIPSATFIEHLISGLADNEVKVYVFGKMKTQVSYTSPNIKLYTTSKHKLQSILITFFRSIILLIRFPKRFFILIKVVSKFNSLYSKWNRWNRYVPVVLHLPTIFHVQWAKDLQYWVFLKDRFNCKIVLSLLGSHINYSPITNKNLASTYKLLFPKVDAFHAVSKAISLEAQKYGADPAKIKLIHSPIQSTTLEMFNTHKKEIVQSVKILSIGRHHWVKGYNYAITAMGLLKAKHLDFQYTIIAQGKVPENLLFQVNQMELQKEVLFLKGINQNELFKKMQNYDVLLLPSLNEGIANVVLEAMALGLLVISTDCGGMSEVVKDQETGWLVPVRDPNAIADAIMEVSKTSGVELQRITQKAHNVIKTGFNAEDSIQEFLELYDFVLSN